jgi:hypothetical protein
LPYDRNDDVQASGPHAGRHDPDWDPSDGRCYTCYAVLLCEIFGGPMGPSFTVNGVTYFPDGTAEIPF